MTQRGAILGTSQWPTLEALGSARLCRLSRSAELDSDLIAHLPKLVETTEIVFHLKPWRGGDDQYDHLRFQIVTMK